MPPFSDFFEQGDFLNGRASGSRTHGLQTPSLALYLLSYGPMRRSVSDFMETRNEILKPKTVLGRTVHGTPRGRP